MSGSRSIRLAPGVALAAALALAAAGCGSTTTTVTDQSPPLLVTKTVKSKATAGEGAAPAANEPLVHVSSFQSPSGNIGCMLIAGTARCDIEHRSWRPPARPAACPDVVDFGQGLEIAATGGARFVCAGDTAREPSSPKLAYGSASEFGPFTCRSRREGVTCTRDGGHGFFISIQSYRIF